MFWVPAISFELKTKIASGIAVGNVFNHLPDEIQLTGRQFAVIHLFAQNLAQNPPEILVTRIRQKTARIGQHTDKSA